MVLLPEDSYKYLARQSLRKEPLQTTQTVGNNLTRKDDEMHQILESSLPADEKWKKYEQLFNQYLIYKNPLKRKLNPSYEDDSDDEDKKLDGIPSEKIVGTLPKTMRRNAKNLLDFMKGTSNQHRISWNEKGILKVNNKEIPGSNIVDLVNDVVRTRQKFSAMNKDAFIQLLNDLSIPREFIGNHELQEAVDKNRNKNHKKNSFRQTDKTLKNDTTIDNFESVLNDTSKVSTPKSVKNTSKTQNGRGWLSLNI